MKKQSTCKRVIVFLLAVSMVFSQIPSVAVAEKSETAKPAQSAQPKQERSSTKDVGDLTTRLGDFDVTFQVIPSQSDGAELTGDNLKIIPQKDGEVSVTMGISLSTSGSEPAKPKELELLIPRSIFQVRGDNYSNLSQIEVDLPFADNETADWAYSYVKEDGTQTEKNDSECKYIKLVNNISIDPAHTQSMGIAYTAKYASHIVDMSNVDFEAIITLKRGEDQETKTSKKLNIQVDTQAEIANAAKNAGEAFASWNSNWGQEPAETAGGEYFYVMWTLSAYVSYSTATQPYELTYTDTPANGGIICGYMNWYSNNSGSSGRDAAIKTRPLLAAPPVKNVPVARSGSSSWYSGVVVAYKKPASSPAEFNNSFSAKLTPIDGKDEPTTKEDSAVFTYKDMELNIPSGEMYYLEKTKGWVANDALYRREHGAIDRILAGVQVDNIAYGISGYAYQYTKDAQDPDKIKSWGAEYTSELIDDMLFLNVNPDCRLGAGDYEITRINPQWEAYEYHENITKGKYEEVEVDYTDPETNYPDLIAWGRSSDTGQWIKIATFEINSSGRAVVKSLDHSGASYYNSETKRGGVNITKGSGFTQIKYSVTANKGKSVEDNEGVIRVRFERRNTPGGPFVSYDTTSKSNLYLTLYPTDKVKAEVRKAVEENVVSDDLSPKPLYDGDGGEGDGYAPVAKLHNIDMLAVYVGKDSNGDLSKQRGAYVGGEDDSNFKDVLYEHDKAIFGDNISRNNTMWHKKAQVELTPYEYDSSISKKSTYRNDPENDRVIISYTASMAEMAVTHDSEIPPELIEKGVLRTQQSGTFYDLLPKGMTVDPASIKAQCCVEDAVCETEYEFKRNYKGSGRTLMIVRVSTDVSNWKQSSSWPDGIKIQRGSSSLNHIQTGFTLNYDGYYDWDSLEDHGNSLTNWLAYESDNDKIENGVDDDPSKWTYTNFDPVVDIMTDLDTTEPEADEQGQPVERPNFLYTNDSTTLTVVTQSRYGLTKKVNGPNISGWTNGRIGDGEKQQVTVPAGGQYTYRLRYASEPGTNVKDMILFDGLEAYNHIRKGEGAEGDNAKSDEVDVDRDDYEVVTWTGTFEDIDVSEIEEMGCKPVVYYTTKARDQLKIDDQSDKSDATVDGSGNLPECWQLLPSDPDELDAIKEQITGIAIDMRKKDNGEDFVLDSQQSVSTIITMRAPEDHKTVRKLVKDAKDQYDNMSDEDKERSVDKPYTYNAVNMNARIKESGQSAYSPSHLITYEYTRVSLYIPKGNISITKKTPGLEDHEIDRYPFKVKATATLPAKEGEDPQTVFFAGNYNLIDTVSGYYYTGTDGVFADKGSGAFAKYVKKNDGGDWVNCDADGNDSSVAVPAPEEAYTFTTEEGQEEFEIKGNQRLVLLDAEADIEWKVEEIPAEGFRTSHTLNNVKGRDSYVTDPFIIGDKNTARIIYTNTVTSELVLEKDVKTGDKDKSFTFTINLTDVNGEEYLDDNDEPVSFDYKGEADEGVAPPEDGKIKNGDTVTLTHGQRIRIYVPAETKYTIKEMVTDNYETPDIEYTYSKIPTADEAQEGAAEEQKVTETKEGSDTAEGETVKAKEDTVKFINTHKPDEPPEKKVAGNDVIEGAAGNVKDSTHSDLIHVDLGKYVNPVTYTISQNVPVETKKMVIKDTIEDVMEFVSSEKDVVVMGGNGQRITDAKVSIEGQTLSVTIEDTEHEGLEKDVKTMVGGSVIVMFVAKLKEGADLSAYAKTEKAMVPNTATVAFNDRSEVESEPVTITPPPEEKIEKKVMDKEHYDLMQRDEEYTYTIDATIPHDAQVARITDTLEKVLEFAGGPDNVKVECNGEQIKGAGVRIDGKKLTVTLEGDTAVAYRTKTIRITFNARISEGADLTPYMVKGAIKVPNTAKLIINDDPGREHESKPVTVTPPDEENPPVKKSVENKEQIKLKTGRESFTYVIETVVPYDASTFTVKDKLEKVLEFRGSAKGVIDGSINLGSSQIKTSGQLLTVSLTSEQLAKYAGKPLVIRFDAGIKKGADLKPYVVNKKGEVRIPNIAEYELDNSTEKSVSRSTDEVMVIPPERMWPKDGPGNGYENDKDGEKGKDGKDKRRLANSKPRTGDDGDMKPFLLLMMASCMVMLAAGAIRRKKDSGSGR